jgi:HAD superfamily hydrolase (TIGR01509 family)
LADFNSAHRYNNYLDCKMGKPVAVIFDMDGVLIDSEPIHYEIEKRLFDKLGITVPEEVHKTYLGAAGDFMYEDIKSRFGLSASTDELLEFDDVFRCAYFKNLVELRLNEGVFDLLNEVKSAGIKMGVATSSSPGLTNILLKRCRIQSLFDVIITTSEAGKSKPAPDVYLRAAQRIGVSPANCIVFEDSPKGLSAANSAGMYCIAIQTNSTQVEELYAADMLIDTFSVITAERLFKIFAANQTTEKQTLE